MSTLVSCPLARSATQTRLFPTASPAATPGIVTDEANWFRVGSIRHTCPERLATQTPDEPAPDAHGSAIGTVAVTVPVSDSILVTHESG